MTKLQRILPRYPIYIPSKGRADYCATARVLADGGVPFHIVVEPPEADAYAQRFGADRIIVLPFHDLGQGSIPARNFIWQHAKASGAERHWTLDDNITLFLRRYRGKRLHCEPGIALAVAEDFTDRYDNIAISGLDYDTFVPDMVRRQPVQVNCHVYSCMLIANRLYGQFQWRGRYNEDTDLCLQVLSTGVWCTVLLNVFLAKKTQTMKTRGGNTSDLYSGDGRLKMARSLERVWPGVVKTGRRFNRPQHVVADNWRKFDTPLRLKDGIDLQVLAEAGPNEYGMQLAQVADTVHSPRLRGYLNDWNANHDGRSTAEQRHNDA